VEECERQVVVKHTGLEVLFRGSLQSAVLAWTRDTMDLGTWVSLKHFLTYHKAPMQLKRALHVSAVALSPVYQESSSMSIDIMAGEKHCANPGSAETSQEMSFKARLRCWSSGEYSISVGAFVSHKFFVWVYTYTREILLKTQVLMHA